MPRWSDPLRGEPMGLRVRLGDEEIELPVGVTLIGRETSCRIKIFDSMISRRHARIQCDPDQAVIEDLGSRNGTRVNGVLVSGRHILHAGDRIGIGSHELLVSVSDPASDEWETPTGLLSVCADCRLGYPATTAACPRCGSSATALPVEAQQPKEAAYERWSLGMLLEILGKAILTESVKDAQKLMREASTIVDDRLRDARPIAADEIRVLVEASAWLDKVQKRTAWSDWLSGVRQQLGQLDRPPDVLPSG